MYIRKIFGIVLGIKQYNDNNLGGLKVTKHFTTLCYISILLMLSSCIDSRYKGHYKVGKSYVINEKTYTPKEVTHYHKVGMASWYGKRFHGKKTANGETFNRHDLTAAHHTLPLPCVVKVTNLKNNKSVVVVVNDRGPFAKKDHRIIDVSEKAAEVLDMKKQGVAKVKVELLPNATASLHKDLDITHSKFTQTIG